MSALNVIPPTIHPMNHLLTHTLGLTVCEAFVQISLNFFSWWSGEL